MNKAKAIFLALFLMVYQGTAQAQFSSDAPILLKMLANSVSQLTQMVSMVRTTRSNLRLLQEVSRGLDSALRDYSRISVPSDPGLYRQWRDVGYALSQIREIYGSVAETREAVVQKNVDRGVAEAIKFNNEINDFARGSDRIARKLDSQSKGASPKGAQRLTAQGIGFLLNAENQSMRTQAALLRLQAQSLARENRKDKEQSRQVKQDTDALQNALKDSKTNFRTPRF